MANSDGSFIRWQGIAIRQMGYAVNLILTFATASLGFALTLFKDASLKSHCWGRCFLLMAGVSLMISIAVGTWGVLNRLRDFRESARIARKREGWAKEDRAKAWIDDQLQYQRETNVARGKLSNTLFDWQVGTFGIGAALLVLAVVAAYADL
jgi:hypothetical protein